ncbi:MAG: BspA family leucine-rich repeat surface protein, partial [Alphaproteobacteria bacterium]|nr:BspA family leucine-rich repeat surface protein [Alphaproteobacteria bacterium]
MKFQLYKFLSWGVGKVLYTFALTLIFLLPTISARAQEAVSIQVVEPYQSEFRLGEALKIGDIYIKVTYDDNSSKQVQLCKAKVSNYDSTTAGNQTVLVEYLGLNTTFDVTLTNNDYCYALYNEDENSFTFYYGKYQKDAILGTYLLCEDLCWDNCYLNINPDNELLTYRCWYIPENISLTHASKIVFDESFYSYKPESCKEWFMGCGDLVEISGIENINTTNVTDMSCMFADCYRLTFLDLSSFDTKAVTNMHGMFNNDIYLTCLDLSSFNTAQVTDMSEMFY